MKTFPRCFCLLMVLIFFVPYNFAQNKGFIALPTAKFMTGDNPEWSKPEFNDQLWREIKTTATYESQGIDYNGYSWYRFHLVIPSSLKNSVVWKKKLRFFLGRIDDVDASYLNGVKIGQTGRFPEEQGGYGSRWQSPREYYVSADEPTVRWDQDNIIAIRVYDGDGAGGLYRETPFVDMLDLIDGIQLTSSEMRFQLLPNNQVSARATIKNKFDAAIKGKLRENVIDESTGKIILSKTIEVNLTPNGSAEAVLTFPQNINNAIQYEFTENLSKKNLSVKQFAPYILTPQTSPKPRINGAKAFGVRPNSPFLFKVAATGNAPLNYSATNLPQGLAIDAKTGIITGKVEKEGDYQIILSVKNKLGKATENFTIKVGNLLGLTPAMGWNSWNAWGLSVNDARVRSSAKAMIDKGLTNHGWTYINIDDGWEAENRAPNGEIVTNQKFSDMKGLGDFLHSQGLKFGIYSSPGPRTCGGFLGSYQHELQDAASYANWGIDYLKYDLCSYDEIMSKARTLQENQKPYELMRDALKAQNRDIYYSLCQYGLHEVWKWGDKVNGNSWRTTGDIEDTWQSLSSIGFSQDKAAPYEQPGRWNDPDMLIVGNVGWSDKLHPTRLTPHEQYTHISLWSLLSAPLLLGCDLASLDDFTLNLLTNDEVIAINQDILGKSARQKIKNDNYQIWVKELEDGRRAIGIFNLSDKFQTIKVDWSEIGLTELLAVRDVWKQKDLGIFSKYFKTTVPSHGVKLIVTSVVVQE